MASFQTDNVDVPETSTPESPAALSSGPLTGPDRRPKPKCTQCRTQRQACQPQPRQWPTKCDRCEKKNWPCSAPEWAPFRTQQQSKATRRETNPSPREASPTEPSPRGRKRRRQNTPSRGRSAMASSTATSRSTSNSSSDDSEAPGWELTDMVSAVCMFQLVATEYLNLCSVDSWLCQVTFSTQSQRLDLLKDNVDGLQRNLSRAIGERLKHVAGHRYKASPEHLLLRQLQRIISNPDIGRPLPITVEADGWWASTADGINGRSLAMQVLGLQDALDLGTTIDGESEFSIGRLLKEWCSGPGTIHMASIARKVGLPPACQEVDFWDSPAVVFPTPPIHYSSLDMDFLGTSWLGIDGIVQKIEDSGRWIPPWRHWRESTELWAPHKRDPFGHTALHLAILANDEELTQKILADRTGDVLLTAQTDGGYTPLHLAAGLGRENSCRLLLQRPVAQFSVQMADKDWWTPIWYAVSNGHGSIFRMLLSLVDADLGQLWRQKDRLGYTLLIVALRGNLPVQHIQHILEHSDLTDSDHVGELLLFHANRSRNIHNVQLVQSLKQPGVVQTLQGPEEAHTGVERLLHRGNTSPRRYFSDLGLF